jgi:dTDP-4-dehydrorhamnose 3,5-epimerase
MKLKKLKIKGAYEILPEPFKDSRGIFRRNFCMDEMKVFMKNEKIFQANLSFNQKKYTLRGFHYQLGKHAEGKLLTCLNGEIFDVLIDLRKNSPTYLKNEKIILSEKNMKSLFVPKGCANAFLTLKDKTFVHYYCTNRFYPKSENGIRYNDPIVKAIWPKKPSVISNKDLSWKNYVSSPKKIL